MTKEQIHEALCKAPDEDKMRLAIACQMNGIGYRDRVGKCAYRCTKSYKTSNRIL